MPAAPISIQQNRPALRPSTSESRGGSQTRPRSPHPHPAISLRVSMPLPAKKTPPSFQWHRHSCLCSDDLRSNFEVESIHRCNPSNQAGFLQPPSPQKKTPPSCIWRRVQIPKLVSLLTLPASPCQSTQIDNTYNNSKRSRPSGSIPSCAKAYTRWVNGSNSLIRQYARIWTRAERKDPKQTAGSLQGPPANRTNIECLVLY
jgi:hypothetical protein